MSAIFTNVDKLIALTFCMGVTAGLTHLFFTQNFYIVLSVAVITGILAWSEIRKDNSGGLTSEFFILGVVELVFRGLFALFFLIASAITS